MSVKSQISTLARIYTTYEDLPDSFQDESDIDSYFYHNILDVVKKEKRLIRLSNGCNKKQFAFKSFIFCDLPNQQRFLLEEEISLTKRELGSIFDQLRDLLLEFDKISRNCQIHPLPKPKKEIGFTLAQDELFSHHYQDIQEQTKTILRICFRIERHECCFQIKKFQKVGQNYHLTQYINLYHEEIYEFYKNCCYLKERAGIINSNYDI